MSVSAAGNACRHDVLADHESVAGHLDVPLECASERPERFVVAMGDTGYLRNERIKVHRTMAAAVDIIHALKPNIR
jgi:hypothetical protein